MNQPLFGFTTATKQIKELLSQIYEVTARQTSLYERAKYYFSGIEQAELQQTQRQLHELRVDRVRQLKAIARTILNCCIGNTPQETLMLSARALGTIQLLSPTKGRHIAMTNQRHKQAYKAILALVLLDRLMSLNLIKNRYVLERWQCHQALLEQETGQSYDPFVEEVQLPLVMALLLQDIGLQHPAAQHILRGPANDLDEFRVLAPAERQALLDISFHQCQHYLTDGLGQDQYIGNSKAERHLFQEMEQDRLNFISHLLNAAIQPADGIGNLLKIPQIYVSVVLPAKQSYKYEHIAKVSAILKAGVTKGWYPAPIVEALLSITGTFPQGFGITYIPLDSDQKPLDRYEYAIVNGLYPTDADQPICRAVTRNLTYHSSGTNVVISLENNLYFPPAQQKLEKMSEERLLEILSKLSSNFEERSQADLMPKCWHPDEYFTYLKNQNLWNKAETWRN